MKEIITRIDYAKIDSYNIIKKNYRVTKEDRTVVEKLSVKVEIHYSASYLGTPVEKGRKVFTLHDGEELSDNIIFGMLEDKLIEYRTVVKKEVANYPENVS